jgi:hypothetical protein
MKNRGFTGICFREEAKRSEKQAPKKVFILTLLIPLKLTA